MRTAEDEEFERIERENRNQVAFKATPSREQLMAEVTVLTELVRVLSDRVAELEKPWVGLTDEEIDTLESATDTLEFPQTVRAIEAKLKEKNS